MQHETIGSPRLPRVTRSHPQASLLRQRAAELRRLAGSIEGSIAVTLDGRLERCSPEPARRAELCEAMLARNVHQLHRAADDLRDIAFRMSVRASELEHPARGAA